MTAMLRTLRRSAVPFMAALLFQACSDGPSAPPEPAVVEVSGTVAASATVASVLSPSVRIADENGRGIGNLTVSFQVTAGGGTVTNATATTNSSGVASAGSWTLGTGAGVNTLRATHGTLAPLNISVTGTAAAAATLVAVSSVNQTAEAGQIVTTAPSVRANDQYGNPVGGVTVTFTVTAGGGSVTGASRITGADGVATIGSWTLGATPGANTVTASFTGGNNVAFNAEATPATGPVLSKFAGDDTTCPIATEGCFFAVRLTQSGTPLAGQTVVWSAPGVASVNATTDIRGIATSTGLASNASLGARTLTATLNGSAQSVTFDYDIVAAGSYDIVIRYVGPTPSAAVQQAFERARQRWQEVITGDLQATQIVADAGDCSVPHAALNEVVDDLLVLVAVDSIDGPAQVLGSAGPCFIRNSNSLPAVGVMRLDSADLAVMAANGRLDDVVLHELGHTLGFPALWDFGPFDLLRDAGLANPYYIGARSTPGFVMAGGTLINGVGVPVENTGGAGTRDGHWRESVFSNELMTGFISGTNNPLSRVTIGALMDIGYQVNFGVADTYMLPGASLRAGPTAGDFELRELPLPAPRVVF